jgi:hypothetical protein
MVNARPSGLVQPHGQSARVVLGWRDAKWSYFKLTVHAEPTISSGFRQSDGPNLIWALRDWLSTSPEKRDGALGRLISGAVIITASFWGGLARLTPRRRELCDGAGPYFGGPLVVSLLLVWCSRNRTVRFVVGSWTSVGVWEPGLAFRVMSDGTVGHSQLAGFGSAGFDRSPGADLRLHLPADRAAIANCFGIFSQEAGSLVHPSRLLQYLLLSAGRVNVLHTYQQLSVWTTGSTASFACPAYGNLA